MESNKITATMTYEEWEDDVDTLFGDRYGVDSSDCSDEDEMKAEWKGNTTPEAFVEWKADKYDMERL